jgi:hypothetical protein
MLRRWTTREREALIAIRPAVDCDIGVADTIVTLESSFA